MKKCISIFVLLALVSAGAFALSIGGGLHLDHSGNNGVKDGSEYWGLRIFSVGAYGFLDFNFAELSVSFASGSLTGVYEDGSYSDSSDAGKATQLCFSFLLKFPIDMGQLVFFPLFGINYNWVLSLENEYGIKADDTGEEYGQIGILAGLGFDYYLTDLLYLRVQGMFQLRFPAKFARDAAWGSAEATMGMGPVIRVGIGYWL